jgi:hypothetical protein
MGLTSHWTADDQDDWRLLDRLLAAIRVEYHPHDEVMYALVVCLAKTIVMAAGDDQKHINLLLDDIKGQVERNVDFQRCLKEF